MYGGEPDDLRSKDATDCACCMTDRFDSIGFQRKDPLVSLLPAVRI